MLNLIFDFLKITRINEDGDSEINVINILLWLLLISLIFGIYVELKKRQITHFSFICNDKVCEVTNFSNNEIGAIYNFSKNEKIISVKTIDISKIKNFSVRYEKIPRTNRSAYTIYAECYDGTSFQLSPVYSREGDNLYNEYVEPLNKKLSKKSINIDFKFP